MLTTLLAGVAVELVFPENGAMNVPTNARVVVAYDYLQYGDPEDTLGVPLVVAVDGSARAGALVHVGRTVFGGSGEVDYGRYLAIYTPVPGFAAGETVVVTLSTMYAPERGGVSFVVGTEADTAPPIGGEIVDADAFDNTSADDDDPGDAHYFGYEATFAPGFDAEGPAFLLLDATAQADAGEPLTDPYVVTGTHFYHGGLNGDWAQGRLRLASQVEDLAGNRGPIDEVFVPLPEYGEGGCRCAVDPSHGGAEGGGVLLGGAIAAWLRVRRRAR